MIQTVRTSFNGVRAATNSFGGVTSQVVLAGGVSNFPSLTGNSLKSLRVKSDESGTEWVTPGAVWGGITGTLASQADLATVLGLKSGLADANTFLNDNTFDGHVDINDGLGVNGSTTFASGDFTVSTPDIITIGGVTFVSGVLSGIASPVSGTDAANKTYVDNLIAGLKWKQSVRVATTANGTLATAFANGQTVDGVVLATGDRILLKNQSTGTENGIYTVNASGAPTRATDADTGIELVNATVAAEQGTTNADKLFTCTNNSITIGSTSIVFVNFASSIIGALLATNNLSDLANANTAITNLGGAAYTGTGGLVRLSNPIFGGLVTSGSNGIKIVNAVGGSVTHTTGNSLDFGLDYTIAWEPSGDYTITVAGNTTIAGFNSGDQTDISGNAGTSTALQNPVTIGGSSFDGTGNVTSFPEPGAIGGTTPSSGAFTIITVGTLGYVDTNILASLQSTVNSYNQVIVQNSNAGATASANVIVSNNQGTATTNFGEFGMNSSGFTGSPVFSQAGYVYLTSTSRDLVIGTTTANAIHFAVNNSSTDSLTIGSGGLVTVATNLIEGFTTTATAAGTTTLTVNSTYQQFFTGSTTQTVTLPVTSTLALGHSFLIVNNSTGLVTVNSSGANAVIILAAGTSAVITCILTSGTTAASWSTSYVGLVTTSGKKLSVSNTLTFAGTDGTTMTFPTTSATIARTDAANTFTGVQTMTSPATTTSITTASTTFTAWAGATTLLTLGGTGASASTNFPSTLNSTSSTTGAVRTAGGLSCAKDLWVGGVANSPNFRPGYTTTATAAGTTTLTVSSNNQQYFTGSTTQTVVMPVTSTLVLGQSWNLVNNSTGIVTVNSSGSNPIAYLLPNTSVVITCILTSGTTEASWSAQRAISLWTPAAIASKIKQFQQIILGNIFTDTACTTAATTNAQTVKGVTPRFGSGPNFTDTTGATLQGIGSLPYLDHSGATLLSSASTITLSGKFVRYFVLRLASGTPGFLFKHNNDYIFDTGGTVYVSRTAYFQQDAATGWLTTGSIVMVKHKCGGNGVQSFLSVNNVPVSFNAIPTGNPGNVTQNSTMEVPGSTINYAHRLYLWAHFDSLQAHEEAAMDAWIRDEYGLTF